MVVHTGRQPYGGGDVSHSTKLLILVTQFSLVFGSVLKYPGLSPFPEQDMSSIRRVHEAGKGSS